MHCEGCQRRAAVWARRLVLTTLQRGDRAHTGAHDAVRAAHVPAFAVDDHAAREHEAAREARSVQRAEQHGGAQVVVPDIVDGVAEILPDAHHRRLM